MTGPGQADGDLRIEVHRVAAGVGRERSGDRIDAEAAQRISDPARERLHRAPEDGNLARDPAPARRGLVEDRLPEHERTRLGLAFAKETRNVRSAVLTV